MSSFKRRALHPKGGQPPSFFASHLSQGSTVTVDCLCFFEKRIVQHNNSHTIFFFSEEQQIKKESKAPFSFSPAAQPLLQLLLGAELVGVSALLLAAVDGTRGEAGIAPSGLQRDRSVNGSTEYSETYLRQIIFSQLYLEARALRVGSMTPPRRRRTRWRVDSVQTRGVHG